jgi:hypothetical protein
MIKWVQVQVRVENVTHGNKESPPKHRARQGYYLIINENHLPKRGVSLIKIKYQFTLN